MNHQLVRPDHVSPEQWQRALRDFETYRRQLPDLLGQGHAGRYALIKDDQVVGVWDSVGDALQVAADRFGTAPVATFKINPLDVDRITVLDAQGLLGKEVVCRS